VTAAVVPSFRCRGKWNERIWTVTPEIRRNPDGSIDEIVATGVDIHLEQMTKGGWYLNITSGDETTQLYLSSKKRISVTNPADAPDPASVPSIEGLSKTVAADPNSEAAVTTFVAPEPQTFITFPSGEITL
jgi:hypothetical protein